MKRRVFVNNAALCAVAVSTSGFIFFDGQRFVGDCESTSDILGPFYRPDSPVRTNLVVKGAPGEDIELTGMILHKDCTSPYKNAKIELWHCSSEGVYDNTSSDFNYRGTTFSDGKGNYSFKSTLPVPYDIGDGSFRPAHFHMMITAGGYLPLITQLYFTGDPHLSDDPSASSPAAAKRILDIQILRNGTKKVIYNVGMTDTLMVAVTALDKLTGHFINEKDPEDVIDFLANSGMLWFKNEVYGFPLDYMGNNTFLFGGTDIETGPAFIFNLQNADTVVLSVAYINSEGERMMDVYKKGK
jgi:catechol 1,2-dioxygenase